MCPEEQPSASWQLQNASESCPSVIAQGRTLPELQPESECWCFVRPLRSGKKTQQSLLVACCHLHMMHVLLWLQVRFVVMGNVFPSDVKLHRRYDLKGSTFGRTAAKKASNPNTVLKVIQGRREWPACLLCQCRVAA